MKKIFPSLLLLVFSLFVATASVFAAGPTCELSFNSIPDGVNLHIEFVSGTTLPVGTVTQIFDANGNTVGGGTFFCQNQVNDIPFLGIAPGQYNGTFKANNSGGTSNQQFNVTIDAVSGVLLTLLNKVGISYSTESGELTVQVATTHSLPLRITNMLGQVQMEKVVQSDIKVNVKDYLPAGVYIISLGEGRSAVAQRIVVR